MDKQFATVAEKYGFPLDDPQLAKLNQLGLTADRFQAICQNSRLLTVEEVNDRLREFHRGIFMLFGVRS